MIQTAMYCFRDLVNAPGDTIAEHTHIIRKHGYCWWGWWMKPVEIVPRSFLGACLTEGRKRFGNMTALLYDCGQYYLHAAKVLDIAIGPGDMAIRSPQPQLTPEYYVHKKNQCWLKLGAIEQIEDGEEWLSKIVYDSLPSWPNKIKSEKVVGKSIASFEELDEMTVTFWGVRIPDDLAATFSAVQ